MINCLNPIVTEFPQMTMADLNELCAGPYLPSLVDSYVTAYRFCELERINHPYVNLATYHNDRKQLSQHVEGWFFDQVEPPANWFGIWPGMDTPNTRPWQACRILALSNIPSRYVRNQTHTAVIAYVPVNWPLVSPAPGLKSDANQRILMYICGPRMQGKCKSGARTCSCCSHIATASYICGVLAHNPGIFTTRWREINYIDAGSVQDPVHSFDLFAGLAS